MAKLELQIGKVEYLADKSNYYQNYYRLLEPVYGDLYYFSDFCNIILEECDDDNGFIYNLGHFNENGEFVPVLWIDHKELDLEVEK